MSDDLKPKAHWVTGSHFEFRGVFLQKYEYLRKQYKFLDKKIVIVFYLEK